MITSDDLMGSNKTAEVTVHRRLCIPNLSTVQPQAVYKVLIGHSIDIDLTQFLKISFDEPSCLGHTYKILENGIEVSN